MKILKSLALLLVIGMISYQSSAQSFDSDILQLKEWMTGSFSSEEQAEADTNFYNIRLQMVPVWEERSDAIWLYVEQAASWKLEKPYRQRVYRLTKMDDGSVESAIFMINNPLQYAGAYYKNELLKTLSPDSIYEKEGCSLILKFDKDAYTGTTAENSCPSRLGGASYATSEVTIQSGVLESLDRGYDSIGNQVWGSEYGPYVFKKQQKEDLPRIAIAGISIESSTFSPAQTLQDAFRITTGEEVFSSYPFLSEDAFLRESVLWFPALRARSIPGGIVTREAYESFVSRTLEFLKENLPYDGLFLDIHGAMSVVGLDDPEGDYIERIRGVVGTETLISTSMDLHGNVSSKLAGYTDLITCYRLAPHEDAMETKERAVANLLDRISNGKGKPAYKAWIPVPILLPGEKTSTRIEPAKSLYAEVEPASKQKGVVDAAIWVGYAWADEPRNHAVVMVTGDDKDVVINSAEKLAKHFWDVRKEFEFVAPVAPLDECLDMAIKSPVHPFIISDMGDNPTAGGAGDVTWTLNEILSRPEFKKKDGPSLIYASIPGPELVEQAIKVGVGGKVKANVGAMVDDRYASPIRLKGIVTSIEYGDKYAETEVVVKVGSVYVIVTKKRKPYHYEKDFTNLGLQPRETDIVVVKIGYLVPELYNMRADWIMALTPGGVDQDLHRLGYERINRPMYPLDEDMEDPDLKARLIPLSDEMGE